MMEIEKIITPTLAAAIVTVMVTSFWYWLQKKPCPNFPPGPKGWPIIGNMLDFVGIAPQNLFVNLAQIYGDVFSIRIGSYWTVVLNGNDTIKEALVKKNPAEFAGRPDLYSTRLVSEGGKDIGFSQYTPTWKLHRKLVHSAFRALATGDHVRFENLVFTVPEKVGRILGSKGDEPFDPRHVVSLAVYNFLSTMIFGKQCEFDDPLLEEWRSLGEESTRLFGNGLMADFFPILQYVPTKGISDLTSLSNRWHKLIVPEIDCHREAYRPGDKPKDFIEMLFQARQTMLDEGENGAEQISEIHIRQTVKDIIIAGSDTSISTLHWALACMVDFPEVQERVQMELEEVVGRERLPSLNDRGALPYTESALSEVMRYATIAPLALPHATNKDVIFGDYMIPRGTWVFANIYSAHYDKKLWGDPENFRPEHFLDDSGKMKQLPEGFLPFSTGRRVCVGQVVAKAELFLIFTWLFHKFTFRKPAGKEDELYTAVDDTALARVLKAYEVVVSKRGH